MRLTLDSLQVLDAIERKGSFAAAAEELFRVPSAMTYTVQKLEQDLGVRLFDRSGHRAKLTPAGEELLKEGRNLLRAANDLECRVKRVATGWEAELNIAYDDIVPAGRLFPMLADFYREASGTRVRLGAEVLGGCWDALLSGRADVVIAAPGDGPAGGGYTTRLLGYQDWVFAVTPDHPLARLPEPLKRDDIFSHRAVAVADSSRSLPPRTTGLLSGQDVLTVPNIRAKLEAQEAGLGVGHLPLYLAQTAAAAGRLVIKQTEDTKPPFPLHIAWRADQPGKALKWFVKRLTKPGAAAQLLAPVNIAVTRPLRKKS